MSLDTIKDAATMQSRRQREVTRESFEAALEEMRKRFIQRTGKYKDGYVRVAKTLCVLFPEKFKSESEAVGFFFVFMNLVKLVRYTDNIDLGHKDSTHDMSVYATMLDAIEPEDAS